jgi:vacuolar protein sorting-associated protein 1
MSSSSQSWSCNITLRFDYDVTGDKLQLSTFVPFKEGITDKKDVNIWLRRAQAAILNPSSSREEFIDKNVDELREITNHGTGLKFSRNVVVLNIMDPDAIDLSFIDLPGMFSCAFEMSVTNDALRSDSER